MENNQKKFLTAVIIILNLGLWGFFIVPNVGMLFQQIFNPVNTQNALQNNTAMAQKQEQIDFLTLRDPFLPAGKKVALNLPTTKPDKPDRTRPPVARATPVPVITGVPDGGNVQRTFVSQFKLKSIIQLKERYIAALEESSHYGNSGGNDNVPYSYRFGTQPETGNAGRSQTVMEGDVVDGERVVKIRESFVILEKNGMYYKLTFSGGFQVKDPN